MWIIPTSCSARRLIEPMQWIGSNRKGVILSEAKNPDGVGGEEEFSRAEILWILRRAAPQNDSSKGWRRVEKQGISTDNPPIG